MAMCLLGVPCVLVSFLTTPTGLAGQVVVGRVLDAQSNSVVSTAQVLIWEPEAQWRRELVSDVGGRFTIALPAGGAYRMLVTALGYQSSDTIPVVLSPGEQLTVDVVLAIQALAISGLVVQTQGFELRHRASIDGFRERLKSAHRVGPARLLDSMDPVFRSAFSVGDLMKWFPADRSSCVRLFIDGIEQRHWGSNLRDIGLDGIEGVEFYKEPIDAPLELRGADRCPILALWRQGALNRPERNDF